jgi:HPt (histidine-containing phosphotransfer) domain-containing protein
VDTKQLLDLLDDDRALLGELVELFRADYPNHLNAAQKAIEGQNFIELERAGHTLKGALGNLSAKQASSLAHELESMGRECDLNHAQRTLDQLASEIEHVTGALEALAGVSFQ